MAGKDVQFHEAAPVDYEAPFDWYLERSERVAARFAAELDRAITLISEAPSAGRLAFTKLAGSSCSDSRSTSSTGIFPQSSSCSP
jgi:plasmid stabilization system protein ParE